MLWLYLLGIATFLGIVARRLWMRQKPLNDELYSKRVAIDHVSSGVGWVTANGKLDSLNAPLSQMLGASAEELAGRDWLRIFPEDERRRVSEAFSQMLLAGIASIDTRTIDANGRETPRSALLVAVHDHKMRLMGHHCILERAGSVASGQAREHRNEFATLAS
jgi:PAS domain S-box-containing protein